MENEYLLPLLGIAIAAMWAKWKKRRRPMTEPKHYISRAIEHELEDDFETALEIRKAGLALSQLTDLERAELLVGIGRIYLEWNDPVEATHYFDQTFQVAERIEFPYDKQYEKIIAAYTAAGRYGDAKRLLDRLIERQYYDKRFKRLEKLKEIYFQ